MKKEEAALTILGVIVDPELRKTYGCEITIEDGNIAKILHRPEVKGPFILPGFIDSHVHIESSMLIPSRFAEMAVKHGTVAVVTDPHEVANVAGEEGIRFMIENAKRVPMNFFFGVPSCVPASPLEKSGYILDSKIVAKMLQDPDFHFLAEMMNFPGVVYNDSEVSKKIQEAHKQGKPIDGHAPGLKGENLIKYANAGITTDHECSTIDEAIEKIKLGMKILIREGSAAKNFKNLIPLIKDFPKDIMFCTDDCHPDYLEKGHINKIVSRAISEGYDLYDVLYAANINPINHYKLPIGRLKEKDSAEFVIVNNLIDFDIISTYIKGQEVFSSNKINFNLPSEQEPNYPFRKNAEKFKLDVICEGTTMNIIGAIEGELITNWIVESPGVEIGQKIIANPKEDLLKIVLLDRYSESEPVVAFIKGFGLKQGALAASIAHDSHHILAIGCDDESIKIALKWIVDNRGGLCYVKDEEVSGLPLPFFGLMTNERGTEVSEKYKEINQKVKRGECELASPFMTASFMALTVIPELKIFHNGLFDGLNFKQVALFD